ncbi:MAG: transglutaminase domain-containing protein [Isosphaeraceae bacterium]
MSRIPRWLVVLMLVGSALGLDAGVGMIPARGQTQEPEPQPPAPPFRRPDFPRRPQIPRRPGAFANRPGPTARPGAAQPKPPRYVMEVTGSKRVVGVYRSQLYTTNAPASQWEVYFPAATEMSRQKSVKSSMEPSGGTVGDASRAHRPVMKARIPVESLEGRQNVTVVVHYEGTLLARKLVPVGPGQAVTPVQPLNFMENFTYLGSTPTLDFRSTTFHSWLEQNQFLRGEGEGDVEFARRVYTAMLPMFGYRDGVDPAPVSTLCGTGVLDCDTLSLVFVGALRAAGVPARVVYGWPTRPLRHEPGRPLSGHTQAEFFAEGTGWVPVDLAYGVTHRDDDPMRYFGADGGDLLVVQVDPDYMVPHPNGTIERIVSIHPGPTSWAKGESKPDVAIRPLSWDVEVSPQ